MPSEIEATTRLPLRRETDVRLDVITPRVVALALAVTGVVIHYGFAQPPAWLPHWLNRLLAGLLVAGYFTDLFVSARRGRIAITDQPPGLGAAALALLAGLGFAVGAATGSFALFDLVVLVLLATALWRLNVAIARRTDRPGLMLPLSFLLLILVGTPLLKLPLAAAPGHELSWLDALFTITSAVCVTGLITRDTATAFSPLGQTVIGVFIQLGGLGIMIFGTVVATLIGARLSLRENLTLSSMLNDQPVSRLAALGRAIVIGTIAIELIGAAVMMPLWPGELSLTRRAGLSLFHAVSAFCNAGFALQTDSLESYRAAWLPYATVLPLLVVGGLGFPVLLELWELITERVRGWWQSPASPAWRRQGGRPRPQHLVQPGGSRLFRSAAGRHRLSLHAKLVLTTTVGLLVYGVVSLWLAQSLAAERPGGDGGVVAAQGAAATFRDAGFMALTARTAGFNTVPMEDLAGPSRFVLVTLMTVGASPGGTGGGFKTTTLALLVLMVAATIRRREEVEAFGRAISLDFTRRAATIAFTFVCLIVLVVLLLRFSESAPFEVILFEAVSATSTTGLSLGLTPDLTPFGKVVIIAAMFLGRVGPLALLAALFFGGSAPRPYAYPHEPVIMG